MPGVCSVRRALDARSIFPADIYIVFSRAARPRRARARGPARRAPRNAKLGLEGLASKTDLSKARVLIRLDLNVPLSKDDGVTITDDTRLRAVVPTLEFLKKQGAKTIIATHIGRPKEPPDPKFSVDPIVGAFSELLGTPVIKADDCVGDVAKAACDKLAPGGVVLLENVRFHKGEKKNVPEFCAALAAASGANAYVNDASAPRTAHASTEGVCAHIAAPRRRLPHGEGAQVHPGRGRRAGALLVAILGGEGLDEDPRDRVDVGATRSSSAAA